MQNILEEIIQYVGKQVELSEKQLSKITLLPCKAKNKGDVACNIFLLIGRNAALEQQVIDRLQNMPNIEKVECEHPGFLNIFFTKEFWHDRLRYILSEAFADGFRISAPKKINVEFVSTNPTGPIHIGHGRNAVLGDVIASLLQTVGHEVSREYYINDAGNQISNLGKSLYLRYLQALGQPIEDHQFTNDMYPGSYLIPLGKHMVDEFEDTLEGRIAEPEVLAIFRHYAVRYIMEDIRADLNLLGINFDVFTSEQNQIIDSSRIQELLFMLEKQGDIYKGILEKPEGYADEDYEEREQLLFKSTKYGDVKDRALMKSDGSWTYFASDLAYHFDKFQRGFDYCIDVWGADHIGYVKRIQASVQALIKEQKRLDVVICQMVNFLENGIPARMSKRSGTFMTVKEVVDDIGLDAFRFMLLSRHQDVTFDFDFNMVREKNKDNLVFYIQYAYARIASVKRHFEETSKMEGEDVIALLTHTEELSIIKLINDYQRQINLAAMQLEPHRVGNYLYELATHLHQLWAIQGYRFLNPEDVKLTSARLYMLQGVAKVIKHGLSILGVQVLEQM